MPELSPELQDYLRAASYLPDDLRAAVDRLLGARSERTVGLPLDEQTAEQFRSIFTERLAQAGFDSDYGLSEEGALLEELIDRFFSP
jgi:hypothetical protein